MKSKKKEGPKYFPKKRKRSSRKNEKRFDL